MAKYLAELVERYAAVVISMRIRGIELNSLVVVGNGSLIIAALSVRVTTIVERLDIAGVELKRPSVVFYSKCILANLRAGISVTHLKRIFK